MAPAGRGRLTINIISSDLPGQVLESGPRYRRTLEIMRVLRDLLDGKSVDFGGEFVNLALGPLRLRPVRGCPPLYFGGLSEAAREVAAQAADVYLMWPDTMPGVKAVLGDMRGAGQDTFALAASRPRHRHRAEDRHGQHRSRQAQGLPGKYDRAGRLAGTRRHRELRLR